MADLNPANPGNILSLFRETVKPVFLLGAGASKTSGIPLAGEITEKIIREAFCRDHGYPIDYPLIQRSDWLPWIKSKSWYNSTFPPTDNYPFVVDNLLRPQQRRRDFFLNIVNPQGVGLSIGYQCLAEMVRERLIDIILTTNFDNCVYNAVSNKRGIILPLKTPNDYVQFSLTPPHALQIFLHGSVEHYSDLNIIEEVQTLSSEIVHNLQPVLRDHPLVVVGYRGGEPSIMKSLLMDNLNYTNKFRHGIWWCLLKHERPEDCPPLVLELANKCGNNFKFIHIDGFDQLFDKELWQRLKLERATFANREVEPRASLNLVSSPTFDTQIIPLKKSDNIEWPLIQDRIKEYSNRLDIHLPLTMGQNRLEQEMIHRNLAVIEEGQLRLTAAGCLLFTTSPQVVFPNATVNFMLSGPLEWHKKINGNFLEGSQEGNEQEERILKGNLWRQLNEIMESLSLINKPYRLKGDTSEAVFPYPPLAIKEVIVNALVHRDYTKPGNVLIEVTPTYIKITNPGGLTEDVKRQVNSDSIESDIIRHGRRGIKGYRNPVLADLFYGSGAMDKAGSGLSDVYRWMNENEGVVSFGPTDDNEAFIVTLYSRQDAFDELTQTASPLKTTTVRYGANILELVKIPPVWSANTSITHIKQTWSLESGDWVPPVVLYGGRIWTFYDITLPYNPLKPLIDLGTIERFTGEEFSEIDNGRQFTRLINLFIQEHFSALGLRIDNKRQRAYFPGFKDGTSRTQSYQARFKKATRTVAKPRVSSTTGKIVYWEHQALSYKFENFGSVWGLYMNPSYVFTIDGWKKLLAPEKVNKLSTKKAARDYNMSVLNSLVFWSRFLSSNEDGSFIELLPNLKRFGEGKPKIHYPQIIFSSILPVTNITDVSLGFDFIESAENTDLIEEAENELEVLANDFIASEDKNED